MRRERTRRRRAARRTLRRARVTSECSPALATSASVRRRGAGAPRAASAPGRVAGRGAGQSGRPLAGARVTLRPVGARADVVTDADVTDAEGRFTLRLPAAVAYRLVVARAGYAPDSLTLAPLAAGTRRAVALTLAPRAQLDVVTVVAAPDRPLLNTSDATTGGAVERREIERLPADARDPIALAYNIPGVAQATGFFGDAPRLAVNGENALYTPYVLDGLENTEGFLGGPRVELPLSALARLEVLASGYGAAWGRSANGVVAQETRAGAARWTGEAFVYNRPGIPLDAAAPVVPPGQDPDDFRRSQDGFRRTQAGGAAGGPLRRVRADGTARSASAPSSTPPRTRTASRAPRRPCSPGASAARRGSSPARRPRLEPDADDDAARRGERRRARRRGHRDRRPRGRRDRRAPRHVDGARPPQRAARRARQPRRRAAARHLPLELPAHRRRPSRPQVTVARVVGTDTVAAASSARATSSSTSARRSSSCATCSRRRSATGRHTLRAGVDAWRSRFRLRASQTNPNGRYVVLDEGNVPRLPDGRYRSPTSRPTCACCATPSTPRSSR
jgi:hypothetical protein